MTKEEAKKEIEKLVERFREHRDEYHLAEYNEQKTRQDFVNPFFKALGWDMDNSGEASEAYREVIHEDRVKVHGKMKAPDYGFRLLGSGDKRLFFVEAKKPSVKLKVNKEPAFQIRRYGLSAQTPVSILTNFEEFVVYDCTKKPYFNDSASVARIKYIPFEDYVKDFDFIYDTFSRDAVIKGRFDKFVKSDTYKKGSQTLDKYFVETLNGWRTWIATSIARNNLELTEDDINFVVQLTIDRLIFLRFCEDRGVEQYGQLQNAIKSGDVYHNLFDIFKQADDKYNSGLFDFEKDKISHNLTVDNKILKTIVGDMYYPQSSYDFRIMPVEIIGNAYEQFLGKVIRINKAHHAVIEDKPEVRKAGGVYYTPQYIVSYIVQNTVGKLIEGKSPKQIESIKIVDPACGSGSFLIGAFQFLLNYHTQWYTDKGFVGKKTKDNPLTPDGKLTAAEKKKILLNNIYGVDIDTNAVEVTKLSLLLKCMEGETEASIKQQLSVFHERVLPDLDNNIKSGNSLIDTDFYDNEIDLGFEKKIKPFNWQKGFPEVFKQGGFDAVIGNPPYLTLQLGKKQKSQEENTLEYYQSHYGSAFEYKVNLFALFMERSISLIKDKGYFSFIVPSTLYNTISFKPIRKLLLEKGSFEIIMDLRYKVFADAEIGGSAVFVYSKGNKIKESEVITVQDIVAFTSPYSQITPTKDFLNDPNFNFISKKGGAKLLETIKAQKGIVELGTIVKIYQGIITGDNKKFISDKAVNPKWQPILKGRDINRFSTLFNSTYVYYSPKDLWSNTDESMFKVKEKIISRQTSDKLIATLDNKGYFSLDSTHVIHLLTDKIDIKYLLGVYNSNLLNFLYQNSVQEEGRVFAQVKTVNLKPLPIKMIDFKNKSEVKSHDEIVKHVDLLLKLNAELPEAKLPEKIEQLKSRIAYSEDEINQLVYELYDLTEDEIKMVEDGK